MTFNDDNDDAVTEFDAIDNALQIASGQNLQIEIIWSALRFALRNSDASIEECMNYALEDWDC